MHFGASAVGADEIQAHNRLSIIDICWNNLRKTLPALIISCVTDRKNCIRLCLLGFLWKG